MKRSLVGLGLLGPVLDRGENPERWTVWRPTVSLFQHPELRLDRFELFYEPKHHRLAEVVSADIRTVSPETDLSLRPLEFDNPWDFEEVFGKLHGLARQYPFDPETEDYLVHITTGSHVQQICLFLLTESRHFPGRLIQTAPPPRKDSPLPGGYTTIDLDLSRYDGIATRFEEEKKEAMDFLKSGISTRNAAFNRQIERLEKVAVVSRAPMLLMGPTGAGKSHLARRIYELKRVRHRLDGAFVSVNCATLRGESAMSALFGHLRGAFTGAASGRQGHLLAADGGVLFLDEIGELGLDEQAMLLQAVEEKRFFPLGSDAEVRSDFQLIAGTNRDLKGAVVAGEFREDLLARINTWSFTLPSLKERLEDIEPNLDYELDRFAEQEGRRVRFNREGREAFLRFATSAEAAWSGNFRDLNGAVYRMASLAPAGRISRTEVNSELEHLKSQWSEEPGSKPAEGRLEGLVDPGVLQRMDLFDRLQLEQVVRLCREHRSLSEAGRRLFQASREVRKSANDADRLRKYLLRFGLNWSRVREGAPRGP